MKISVLGAGAMGSLFGAYLSQHNEVWLIEIDSEKVSKINQDGIRVSELDGEQVFRPAAVRDSSMLGCMDLILIFVKSMFTEEALTQNMHLISSDTYLMTLQNGAGHESKLLQFVDPQHVLIGMTQHNSSMISTGHIHHGGGGKTAIGCLAGNDEYVLSIVENFCSCGIKTEITDNIQAKIWEKLFLNTSASSLTGILQVPLGFIVEDPYASGLMEKLVEEAVAVANADCAAHFDADCIKKQIREILLNSRNGYTSIYMDIKSGNLSEVDTISGYVCRTAKRFGIEVPYHDYVVAMVHAMENKSRKEES